MYDSYVLIDNVGHVYGKKIKPILAKVYKNMGYKILVIGEDLEFSDYYIPYFPYINESYYFTEDYLNDSYKGQNLFKAVEGTIGRKFTNQLKGRYNNKPDCIEILYSEYIKTVDYLVAELAGVNISLGVTWGGMFLHTVAFRNACKELGIPVVATEFTFDKDRIYYDSIGEIGNRHSLSSIHSPNIPVLNSAQLDEVELWIKNQTVGKSGKQASKGVIKNELFGEGEINVLLICQCRVDTVVNMDNPFFDGSLEAYEELIDEIITKFLEVNLIVRIHPGDLTVNQKALVDMVENINCSRIRVSDKNDNIYSVMKHCQKVITINSQAGLEAYVKGLNVLTLGNAFYSGHGFGLKLHDYDSLSDAISGLIEKNISSEELLLAKSYLHYYLYDYSVNYTDKKELHDKVIDRTPILTLPANQEEVRMAIFHPSPRYRGSGFYLQELAETIQENGGKCLILSEGSCPFYDNGVKWLRLDFNGPLLSNSIKKQLNEFNPTIIYQVGVRTVPMRAALETFIATRAKFLVQAEDDEFIPYMQRSPNPDIFLLESLDKPKINKIDLDKFLLRLDKNFIYQIFADPYKFRWIDPLMRIICYRISDMHTSIWYQMEKRLKQKFQKPSFVIPPCINISKIKKTVLRSEERNKLLTSFKIPENSFIFFINGTIYDYSDEYVNFIKALKIVRSKTSSRIRITLLVAGRIPGRLLALSREEFKGIIYFRNVGSPNEVIYNKLIIASDVICAPGFNDIFNKYRLSSRLVKAMALGKPVFTYKNGLGESLIEHKAGFITKTNDAIEWASLLKKSMDEKYASEIAENGYRFAVNHFDSKIVYKEFYLRLQDLLKTPSMKIDLPSNLDIYKKGFMMRLIKLKNLCLIYLRKLRLI